MSTTATLMTYEEYLASPETMQRYDIIDGEMIMSPAPTPKHQWILGKMYKFLDSLIESKHLGMVLFAPIDVLISREPLRIRQPDLLYISTERRGDMSWDALLNQNPLTIAPDLVMEILSPTNTRIEMETKCADYGTAGVNECWVISPEAQTIEVIKLTSIGSERLGIYGTGSNIESAVLNELELPVDTLLSGR